MRKARWEQRHLHPRNFGVLLRTDIVIRVNYLLFGRDLVLYLHMERCYFSGKQRLGPRDLLE